MKIRLGVGGLLVPLTLAACASEPAPLPPASGPAADFSVLSGADARAFRMPSDVVQVTTFGSPSKGFVYERYQQMFGPAEVAGAQITVQRDGTGGVEAVGGKHFDAIAPSNSVQLSNADALAIAQAALPEATSRSAVLRIEPGDGRYFYAVDSRGDALRVAHWIDAETGAIFNQFNALTGGCDFSPGGVGIMGEQYDLNGKVTAPALAGGKWLLSDGHQTTRDLGSQRKPFYATGDQDDNGCYDAVGRTSPGQAGLVSAHVNVMAADAYYRTTYFFDLASHTSNVLTVWAHKDVNYSNAYWDGTKMVFGDGDGIAYGNFAANDVAAHEISHGVTEFTSNLVYQGESGALNESFSDIMGYTIADPDPLMGEDVTLKPNAAGLLGFRNMADPTTHGDPGTYCDRYTGTSDSGGVHSNSGISNRAFYLVATSPIGAAAAADIFFKAYTTLGTNATFVDARTATEAQALIKDDGVAGAAAAAVASAWDTVKVGSPDMCTVAPPPGCTLATDCADDADTCTSATCTAGVCGQADNGTCGGPTCTASNGTCSSNADCCSNSCRTSGKKKNTCT